MEVSLEKNFGVFAPKVSSIDGFFYFSPRPGLNFLQEKPSSHGIRKKKFFLRRAEGWEVPTAWRPSSLDHPQYDLEVRQGKGLGYGFNESLF